MSVPAQYVAKFALKTPSVGILRDLICTRCGQRDKFEIAAFGMVTVVAVDRVEAFRDVEWPPSAFCRCPTCDSIGIVTDFTVPGLDDFLRR